MRAIGIPARWIVVAVLLGWAGAACRGGAPPAVEPRPEAEPETEEVRPALVDGPATEADEARAEALLAEARAAYEAGDLARARETVDRIVERYATTPSSVPALWLAARTAFEAEEYKTAVEHARRYAGLFSQDASEAREARALIGEAEEAWQAAREAPVRLGVILPLSGSPYLKQYGDLVLEGVRLAEQEHERGRGRPLELIVRDDAGQPERVPQIVRGLEEEGVAGIVGPLLDRGVTAAARAREDTSLVIVSPTAADVAERRLPNVYSLSAGDTRGAEALADYALAAGFRRAALLYPRIEQFERRAERFAQRFSRGGGVLVERAPYDSATTSFAEPLELLAERMPEAVYIPAPGRGIRQIAPQIAFYGLDTLGVQVFGDADWVSEEVQRVVSPRHLEGVIASTPVRTADPTGGWSEFVSLYENTYRRSLDNRFPALGYDAVRLLLSALPLGRARPADVAERFADLRGLRGATGEFTVEEGSLVRWPFLIRIRKGEPVTAPAPQVLELERLRQMTPVDSVGTSADTMQLPGGALR